MTAARGAPEHVSTKTCVSAHSNAATADLPPSIRHACSNRCTDWEIHTHEVFVAAPEVAPDDDDEA